MGTAQPVLSASAAGRGKRAEGTAHPGPCLHCMTLPKGLSHPRPGAPRCAMQGLLAEGSVPLGATVVSPQQGSDPAPALWGQLGGCLFPSFFFFNKGGSEFCCNCISNNYFGLSAGGSSQGSGSNKSAQSSWLECKWHSAVWAAERSPRSPFPPHARATRLPQPPHDGGQLRQHAVFGAVPLFPAKSCHPGKVIWKSASTSGSRSPSPRMCLCMPLTHALYHT